MKGQRPRHISYLLRLWQVESDGDMIWRASLQDARTGERRGFPSLQALFAYITAETRPRLLTTGSQENKGPSRH